MALRQNPSKVVSDRHCSRANSGKKTKKTQNKTTTTTTTKKRIYWVAFFPIQNENNFIASNEENVYPYKLYISF